MDFLLNKASQYSSFISRDLDELQAAMTDSAQRAADKKANKKRKGDGKAGGKGSKKSKKNNGSASGEALQKAQAKDAKNRKEAKKIIFTQPPNLSKGCVLKDYQLEGVRWLASLFENGVSGILADEVSSVCIFFVFLLRFFLAPWVLCAMVSTHFFDLENTLADGTWKNNSSDRFDCAFADSRSQWPIPGRRPTGNTSQLGAGIRKVASS